MARAKYIIKTEGNRTIIHRRGRKAPSGSTSAPPWEEIRHLFENLPDVAPKPKRKRKKR